MSTLSERKCSLLLVTFGEQDRRRLLASLPDASASVIRSLVAELERMPWPMEDLTAELLADEGSPAEETSLDLDELVDLSSYVSPAWFARVLSAWGGTDQAFSLALLDAPTAVQVRRELDQIVPLAPKMVEALKVEALLVIRRRRAA